MAFDFHLHLQEDSRQAQVIQTLAQQQQITPKEAAQRIWEEAIQAKTQPTPAEEMWGAFSSDEDSAITDEAMKYVHAMQR